MIHSSRCNTLAMGNSTSKAEDDEASLFDKENTGQLTALQESGSKGVSYEGDSFTVPDSKSSLGTSGEYMPNHAQHKAAHHSSPQQRMAANNNNKSPMSRQQLQRRHSRDVNNDNGMHNPNHHHITDDQVHVNLAMADLMAYLQVVANNSNNLPLTRRDDPELGRTVSNLTGEEYARKSAAFIPADVRVIGGAFTRYGRVWDLPTSEEFNACDGAQEPGKNFLRSRLLSTVFVSCLCPFVCVPFFSQPTLSSFLFRFAGKSYGGACCNSMLKVLYDSANDATDAAQTKEASDALFDDDEDEESILGKSVCKSVHSLEFAPSNPATISWAALLRRMKAEIGDIEHAQHPILSTTRKFDLSQAFSIVPVNFNPTVGKKRSLLIGCNYTNIHGAELKASHDDIGSVKVRTYFSSRFASNVLHQDCPSHMVLHCIVL